MPSALEDAALTFAKICLKQPDSYVEALEGIAVRPDGYNSGPEAFADMATINCIDLNNVLQIVSYWCSLNDSPVTGYLRRDAVPAHLHQPSTR